MDDDQRGSGALPFGNKPAPLARRLGYAGLLPQAAVVLALLSHDPTWYFSALTLGYAYAALILSFLGGMWWGIASTGGIDTPGWIWPAAVTPTLIALGSAVPWAIGAPWPRPSLLVLGVSLIASLAVDARLRSLGLCPIWWMALRTPLSLGLGALTLVMALVEV